MSDKVFWRDGRPILSERVKALYRQGRLVNKEVRPNGIWYWVAICSEISCVETYDATSNTCMCQQGKCHWHVKRLSKSKKFSSKLIAGHKTSSPFLWKHRRSVVWKFEGKAMNRVPHLRCKIEGCENTKKYKSMQTSVVFLCADHARFLRRGRPYEHLFNKFKSALTERNKKRQTKIPLRLTFRQFAKFCRENVSCFYCGEDTLRPDYKDRRDADKLHAHRFYLDRIDNSKGYEANNIISACYTCNMTRHKFLSVEEMQIIAALRNGDVTQANVLSKTHRKSIKKWGQEIRAYRMSKGSR